ncbi:hypothetical protein BDZ94DRAFT_1322157 [Collybia nuda]|uniref:Uncharacterized protein n=1 Tax=Collybia nuda TaxID=64659 RepID=A0A9P5Y6G3_9AGAR|nr:hypothetical protein BDZ94DRAFT_1322157 [Collybia nuda]
MALLESPHRNLSTNQQSLALQSPKFTSNSSTHSLGLSSLVGTLSSNYSVTTVSTSSTVPGPGALSGKAILALGKATLRGAENLMIRRRLQAIDEKFPHNNEDEFPEAERMYQDVLELSRRDMYPDVHRSRALRIILVQIGTRQTDLLVKALTTWASVEVDLLISYLTAMFDPLRLLFTMRETGKVSSQVRAYRASLGNSESHSLGPLVLFFRQLVRYSLLHSGTQITRMIMEGSVMNFLLHLYHSNFADPFPNLNAAYDRGKSIYKLCKTLLEACSRIDQRLYNNHRRDRFYALWTMEQYLLPKLENTLRERTEMLRLTKSECVVSFIRLVSHMMDDWPQEPDGQSSIYYRVIFSLIESSGFPFEEPEINFLALRALQTFVTIGGPNINTAFRRYAASRCTENLSDLMTCIFERISQLIPLNILDWDMFISRWHEPNLGPADESTSRANGMLEVIDCFIGAAGDNQTFLDALIEADLFGILQPFLEVELRTTPVSITEHQGVALMTFNNFDLATLHLLSNRCPMGPFAFPRSRNQSILNRACIIMSRRLWG